ncbi:hypothetical protein [Lysinibacillus agricola]|uniref:hypothetical protein n=1 Tax=Lysinibacillus agricola TaxID=2590012 RepID=UPI003C1C6E24
MDWKQICKKKIEALTGEIEQLRVKAATIKSTDDHDEILQDIIETQLKAMEKEKTSYVQTHERIEQLLNEQMTIELLNRFKQDIHLYSHTEKRAILMLAIKSIAYDFKRNDFEIEYRLTPYVEIEALIGSGKSTRKTVV